MKNGYEIRGSVTAIFLNSPKYGQMETIISTNKLKRAQEFAGAWCVKWDTHTQSFYCQGNMKRHDGKWTVVKLHRWITNCPKDKIIDHQDNNTLNNTDCNLREVTNSENSQNRKGASRTSKTGIRGVYWHARVKKWRARVRINGKYKQIGEFDNISEAEKAVKEARAKYMPYSKEALSMKEGAFSI